MFCPFSSDFFFWLVFSLYTVFKVDLASLLMHLVIKFNFTVENI